MIYLVSGGVEVVVHFGPILSDGYIPVTGIILVLRIMVIAFFLVL